MRVASSVLMQLSVLGMKLMEQELRVFKSHLTSEMGAFDEVNDGLCIILDPQIVPTEGSGMFQSSQTSASAIAELCALHGWQPAARVASEDEVKIRPIPVGRSGAIIVSSHCKWIWMISFIYEVNEPKY